MTQSNPTKNQQRSKISSQRPTKSTIQEILDNPQLAKKKPKPIQNNLQQPKTINSNPY